jgi:hypothetical protein
VQYLKDANGNGKYGFIVAIPANVINIFGGVLSANQVPVTATDCCQLLCLCFSAATKRWSHLRCLPTATA